MAKSSMDEEARCIQRSAREIEKLDDDAAKARVAMYLYLRYTAAGDHIAPGGEPIQTPARWRSVPPAPDIVSATASSQTPRSTAVPVADDGDDPGDPGDAAGDSAAPGWDLSSEGSEKDDNAEDTKPPALDTSELDGAEEDVEI